jgi:hypothetical protein
VIRSEATEFRYERAAQPLPKLGPWVATLDELLMGNEAKPARERLTLIRVFEELRGGVLRAATMRCGAMPGPGQRTAAPSRPKPSYR